MIDKIRVLQVIPTLTLEGISSVVMNWYRNIDKDKFQFDFITFNDGPLRKEIEATGGQIFLLPTLKQNPIQYYKLIQNVFNNHAKYHVVHVHNSFKNGALLWLAKKAKIPVRVCHSHTSGLESTWLKPIFGSLKFIANANSNVHVACGQKAGEFLFKEQDFTVLNNAIDVNRFLKNNVNIEAIKQRFSLPLNKKLILHVGRFSTVKNHQFMVNLANMSQLSDELHFVFIGEGPLKNDVANSIEQFSLNNTISLLSPTNEIPELLQCADAFIMPSLFEGVSVALLEAQASKLPCFIADTIAKESDIGLNLVNFLPLEQPELWVKKLNELAAINIRDVEVIAAFDNRAFSIKGVINILTRIYQQGC